jgi:galactokinase/mevalonate kinase-like predicted kinase
MPFRRKQNRQNTGPRPERRVVRPCHGQWSTGGKLIGAGDGGFLMFYAHDKSKLRHAMREKGLTEARFRFDLEDTKIVIQE